jgi:soluble lytic murein transglycosylase-like protein
VRAGGVALAALALAAHPSQRATASSARSPFVPARAVPGAFPTSSRSLAERPSPPADAAAGRAQPAIAASGATDPVARWRPFVEEASRRFGVPIEWIEGVMRAESGGRTALAGRAIVSRAGAIGLMQLMPGTWAAIRASEGLGPDPFDPRDNILAGTAYLAAMYRRFGYPGLFGAYNAGPARYAAWLEGRGTLPAETRVYLARLTGDAAPPAAVRRDAGLAINGGGPRAVGAPKPSSRERLFAVDRGSPAPAAPAPSARGAGEDRPPEGLFVALSQRSSAASED